MKITLTSPFSSYLDTLFAKEFGSFFLPLRGKEEELRNLSVGEALKRIPIGERFIPDLLEGMNDALERMSRDDFAYVSKTNPAARYLAYPVDKEKGKVIILPGGGYEAVAGFVEGYPIAKEINSYGYSAYVLNYSCGVNALFPRPMLDVSESINHIIPEASRRYAILGFSAGGHLAGSICLRKNQDLIGLNSRPGVLGLGYPVISFYQPTHGGTRERVLGERKNDVIFQKAYSIEENIDDKFPPTFCWCGEGDDCVPSINSHMLEATLAKKSIKREFLYGDFKEHGLGRAQNTPMEGWTKKFIDFCDKNLCKYLF